MDKNIIFVCSEQKKEFFTSQLKETINHLKELKGKKNPEGAFVNLHTIVVGDKTSDDGLLDTDSGHVKLTKHCLDEEDPLAELLLQNESTNKKDEEEEEEFRAQDFLALADCLHQVADDFGEVGSYLVYVIWCIKSYIPDAGEVCEVFAALHRLQLWHNACVAFVTPDSATVAGWPSALPLMVSCDAVRVVDDALKCMWRGDIFYSVHSDSSEGEEELVCVPHVAISCVAGQAALVAERQKNGRVFVSRECEVVSSIQLSSLPPLFLRPGPVYSVRPVQDQLQPASATLQHTCAALHQLAPNQQEGSVLRLKYSHSAPKLEGAVEGLTTEHWKKVLAEGVFDTVPAFSFGGRDQECLLHLLTLSACSRDGSVSAMCLRPPGSLGDDVWRLVGQHTHEQRSHCNEEDPVRRLLKATPFFSSLQMNTLAHLQLHLPTQITKKLQNKGNDLSNLWEQTKDELETLASQEVLALVKSYKSRALCGDVLSLSDSGDDWRHPHEGWELKQAKDEWPEYRALVAAERRDNKERARHRQNTRLLGMSAPSNASLSSSTVVLDARQLTRIFQEDPVLKKTFYDKRSRRSSESRSNEDEIRSQKKTKITSVGDQYPFKANTSPSQAISAKYPEALFMHYHGIHYNRDIRREKYEEECNRARQRHIRVETASFCSTFCSSSQLCSFRAPATASASVEDADKTRGAAGGRQLVRGCTSVADADTASMRSTSSSVRRAAVAAAVRRSPRKLATKSKCDTSSVSGDQMKPSDLLAPKKPSTMRPSDLLLAPRQQKAVSSAAAVTRSAVLGRRGKQFGVLPTELSDVHKQKLRGAVLTALEEEGIKMKDKLFKVCFKKLFAVCRPFAGDVIGRGSTSRNMEKIARSHVKQVIDFEKKLGKR